MKWSLFDWCIKCKEMLRCASPQTCIYKAMEPWPLHNTARSLSSYDKDKCASIITSTPLSCSFFLLPVGCHIWTRSCCCSVTGRRSSATRWSCAPLSPSFCRLSTAGYSWRTRIIPERKGRSWGEREKRNKTLIKPLKTFSDYVYLWIKLI